jgi:hypothetical protein
MEISMTDTVRLYAVLGLSFLVLAGGVVVSVIS